MTRKILISARIQQIKKWMREHDYIELQVNREIEPGIYQLSKTSEKYIAYLAKYKAYLTTLHELESKLEEMM